MGNQKVINILDLLRAFKARVKRGEVQFLKEDSNERRIILRVLEDLISDFQDPKDPTKQKEKLSEELNWHETHEKGRELWQNLASCALNNIDPGSKGNSILFKFLEAATKFEDLLYGLEPFYRDHTLHSLWVYFIGEYMLRELLPNIYENLNWYLFNDIAREKDSYEPGQVTAADNLEKELHSDVNIHKDAIWCIMALCHDLGYSLAKLEKLNERVQEVLKFFEVPDFQHVGYSLAIEHQYLISQFLELMAMEVRLVPNPFYEKNGDMKPEDSVLIKCYRDDSSYWRLCNALEKKEHGVLSAYLIYKTLGIFADAWIRGPAEEWGLEQVEAKKNIILGDILYAMAQHEFKFAHLYEFSSLADILILADELEEFSRFGRQLLSRRYYDTTAEVKIIFKPQGVKQGEDIDIEIEYVANHKFPKEFYEFFRRKAERLCGIYSLEQAQTKKEEKLCEIRSIKLVIKGFHQELYFHLCRDPNEIKGWLPNTKLNGKTYPSKEYKLKCYDDKIRVIIEEGEIPKEIPLNDWLDRAAGQKIETV